MPENTTLYMSDLLLKAIDLSVPSTFITVVQSSFNLIKVPSSLINLKNIISEFVD